MIGPNIFLDPQQRPVRFVQKRPQPIFAFGESVFPVSFSFDGSPRKARFVGGAAGQLDTYLTDKDPYGNQVVQLAIGMSQSIELMASGSDVNTALFYLKTTRTDNSAVISPAWSVLEMRQPSFTADIEYSFSTDTSAKSFDQTGGLYPAATMNLNAHRMLSSEIVNLTPATTSKDAPTRILLAPSETYGIVDVEVDIIISWYSDAGRTVLASGPSVDTPRFGVRLYVSAGGRLSQKIVSGVSCVVSGVYPTSVLRQLGGSALVLAYWGGGQDGVGLFWGVETAVDVSSNGLAIQNAAETATYILENKLEDYDASSSSSSTIRFNSSSSSSLLDVTSGSSLSSSSPTSPSSKSGSSHSSKSSSASSLSSMSSTSSISDDSSSSSTAIRLQSSSSKSSVSGLSSQSSSSSMIPAKIAEYSFSVAPDVFGVVIDDSGNGRNLSTPPVSGNLGPPVWSSAGVSGGGFLFAADATHSNYLQAPLTDGWLSQRGSISLWVTPNKSVPCVIFGISNGFVSGKTELAVGLNQTTGSVSAWLMKDGITLWAASTGNLVANGVWSQIVVTNNGILPKIYVNGDLCAVTFSESANLTTWSSTLATATSAPDRVLAGAAARYYSPFVTLGFSGQLDELSIWDNALSAGDVSSMYEAMQDILGH